MNCLTKNVPYPGQTWDDHCSRRIYPSQRINDFIRRDQIHYPRKEGNLKQDKEQGISSLKFMREYP